MSAPMPEWKRKATKGLGGKEPNMLIIGCDYHPGFQQIALWTRRAVSGRTAPGSPRTTCAAQLATYTSNNCRHISPTEREYTGSSGGVLSQAPGAKSARAGWDGGQRARTLVRAVAEGVGV